MSEESIPAFNNSSLILRDANKTYNGEQVVAQIIPQYGSGSTGFIELSAQGALALANELMARATIRHVLDDEDNMLCKMSDEAGLVREISTERGKGPLCQNCKRVVEEAWLV